MRRRLSLLLSTFAAGIALLASPGVAGAAPGSDTLQKQVDAALAAQPGGVQTSESTVTWDDGAVTLNLAATGLSDCLAGQFCLWADNWGGRMLAWTASATICSGSGVIINLGGYAFHDQASSWANNSSYFVDVWGDPGGLGAKLWQMLPGSSSQYVDANDQASSLNCHL